MSLYPVESKSFETEDFKAFTYGCRRILLWEGVYVLSDCPAVVLDTGIILQLPQLKSSLEFRLSLYNSCSSISTHRWITSLINKGTLIKEVIN